MSCYLPSNVLNTPLQPCYLGIFSGERTTARLLSPRAVICIEVTAAFLDFSLQQGIDLYSPRPQDDFGGLKAGDRWFVTPELWLKACEASIAPRVVLECTDKKALKVIPLTLLLQFRCNSETAPAVCPS